MRANIYYINLFQVSWTHALRQIVTNCYKFHGREDLLPQFNEDDDNNGDDKPDQKPSQHNINNNTRTTTATVVSTCFAAHILTSSVFTLILNSVRRKQD